MKIKYIVFAILIGNLLVNADPMNIDSARSQVFIATGVEFDEAISVLKYNKDNATLLKLVNSDLDSQKRIKAIEALSTIASKADAKSLVKLLRESNANVVMGGTEQQTDHDVLKRALIKSLSFILSLPETSNIDEDHIKSFLASCDSRLESGK